MLDMGWAEIGVLFVLALLIFGPDKLPKFAADAAGMIRKLRELAQSAQTGLTDQGIDVEGIKTDLQSVAELHPKRIMGSVVGDLKSAAEPIASAGAVAVGAEVVGSDKASTPTTTATAASPAPASKSEKAKPATVKVVESSTKIDPDAT